MAKLSIELVPKTSWHNNVRSNVTRAEWDKIRRIVYAQANYCCEVCGGKGKKHPVECHEIWEYDDMAHIQKLTKLVALCPACHSVKHIGRASIYGGYSDALSHLSVVNGWSIQEAHDYVQKQYFIWHQRSQHQWSINIDVLKEYSKEDETW